MPTVSPLPVQDPLNDVPETHYCEICDRIFVGRRVWESKNNYFYNYIHSSKSGMSNSFTAAGQIKHCIKSHGPHKKSR